MIDRNLLQAGQSSFDLKGCVALKIGDDSHLSFFQINYYSKSAYLSTTSTVMFSDEKSKFYVAAGTVETDTIRYPHRGHFSRLKKK